VLSLNPQSRQYGLCGFYGDLTSMTIKNDYRLFCPERTRFSQCRIPRGAELREGKLGVPPYLV
jgi:hypothetical protein